MTPRIAVAVLLLLLAACRDATPSARADADAAAAAAVETGDVATAFLEMRVNDWGTSRYIRVERSGHVEFARHDFTRIKVFRAGTPAEPLAARILDAYRDSGLDAVEPPAGGEDEGPVVDPSDVRLEIRDGAIRQVVIYRVSALPEKARAFHDMVLETSFAFPENPLHGDYVRQYVVHDRSTLPEDAVIRKLAAAELEAMPAVREALRFPGRLFHAGAAGGAPLRAFPDLEPSGCFVEVEGVLHRFSLFTWEP